MIDKVSLTDVCDFQGGTQPPKNTWSKEKKDGFIRMLQIRDFTQPEKNNIEYVPHKKTLKTCHDDDVLIGRYGASIGKLCTGLSGAYNVALIKVIPNKARIETSFLLHLLRGGTFQHFIQNIGGRAAQAGFNKSDLEGFYLTLPPLDQQKKIAAILDAADAYRQKTKALIDKYDQLCQSLFLEMFGDPIKNTKNLPIVKGREFFKFSSGKNNPTKNLSEEFDYPTYGGNGITGYFHTPLIDYKTIVIGRVGAYCGSVHITEKESWITDNAIYVKSFKEEINLNYAYYFLKGYKLNRFADFSGQPKITQKPLEDMNFINPQISLQDCFSEQIELIEKQKAITLKSINSADKLFNSLLQKAFKGELTT